MSINAAIFILTQNNVLRRTHLKTCLYFLCKNFLENHKYPVVIFHEGDYDVRSQEEIFKSVRVSCRSLITFRKLDKDDFAVPDFIDKKKLQASVDLKCTPYWRSIGYRNMCRWWIVHMPRYAKSYDYVMRIDDDLYIEDPINEDIIAMAASSNQVYISNMIHVDCPVCCYGFKELLCEALPEKSKVIEGLFQKQEAPWAAHQLASLRSLLSIIKPEMKIGETTELWSPVMNYNNFHITKSEFWQQPEVQRLVDIIDRSGYIYYFRLGDSPIQSAITMLLAAPNELGRVKFRYSKRLQREAHEGDDGCLHSYMPPTYKHTSDITETSA